MINVFTSRKALLCLVGVLIIGSWAEGATAPAAVPASSREPARVPSYSERYGVLAEHNIFVRDRSSLSRSSSNHSSSPSTRPTIQSPEQTLALRGVVIEEGVLRAYVEDLASGRMLRLNPGDSVARGKISDIDIDAIQYESAGHRQWIAIGDDLTGHPALVGSFYVGGLSSSSSTQPSGPPIDPNNPNLTLEERMRLRRQQGK